MNIEEIKAAATNVLEHHGDYGGHEIALARALLAALPVVEAARLRIAANLTSTVGRDGRSRYTIEEMRAEHAIVDTLAAFDKAIEGMKL